MNGHPRRPVITGFGALSCIGNDAASIHQALLTSRSGITTCNEYKEKNMKCHVSGAISVEPAEHIERKQLRFMGRTTAYASIATQNAVTHAGLTPEQLHSERTAAIIGAGGNGITELCQAVDIERDKGTRKLGPYFVTKVMDNAPSAAISTNFRVRGPSYSVSSACATSAHCIGIACEQILLDNIDCALAGGAEEETWQISMLFDAMGALSNKYNDLPATASRPFDNSRDGFVPSGGAGIVVVEEREHALKRGANILAEVIGYAATSDGHDMVAPSGEGSVRCMRLATRDCDQPDYINAHATSTPAGDIVELQAVREVFGANTPPISSTKALTGHALGAAGALELIYSMIMLQHDFITPCANLDTPDEGMEDYPLPRSLVKNAGLQRIMSNSFGFGGTNASLILQKHEAT